MELVEEYQDGSDSLCDNQAEQAVLGAMLLRKEMAEQLLDELPVYAFYHLKHQYIFQAIADVFCFGIAPDPITVAARLTQKGLINKVGGAPYLHLLFNSVPTAANGPYYADIVKRMAVLQKTRETAIRIGQMARETNPDDVTDIMTVVEREFSELRSFTGEMSASKDVLSTIRPDLMPYLDGTYEAPKPTVGARVDGAGVFYGGEVNRVYGKSESGKTWFVLYAAVQQLERGLPVVYCDYENGMGVIVPRLLALGAKTESILDPKLFCYLDLRDDAMTAVQRQRIADMYGQDTMVILDSAVGVVSSDDKSSNSEDDVEKKLRSEMAVFCRSGHAVVFIDHESDRVEGGGRSSGSHRKRGLLGGVSYYVQSVSLFVPYVNENTVPGRLRVYVDKDRNAGVRAASVPVASGRFHFGDFVGHPQADGSLTCRLYVPDGTAVMAIKGGNGAADANAEIIRHVQQLDQAGAPDNLGREKLVSWAIEHKIPLPKDTNVRATITSSLKALRKARREELLTGVGSGGDVPLDL